jgi:hypothetical protein
MRRYADRLPRRMGEVALSTAVPSFYPSASVAGRRMEHGNRSRTNILTRTECGPGFYIEDDAICPIVSPSLNFHSIWGKGPQMCRSTNCRGNYRLSKDILMFRQAASYGGRVRKSSCKSGGRGFSKSTRPRVPCHVLFLKKTVPNLCQRGIKFIHSD